MHENSKIVLQKKEQIVLAGQEQFDWVKSHTSSEDRSETISHQINNHHTRTVQKETVGFVQQRYLKDIGVKDCKDDLQPAL